jgi:hypothetical protein
MLAVAVSSLAKPQLKTQLQVVVVSTHYMEQVIAGDVPSRCSAVELKVTVYINKALTQGGAAKIGRPRKEEADSASSCCLKQQARQTQQQKQKQQRKQKRRQQGPTLQQLPAARRRLRP